MLTDAEMDPLIDEDRPRAGRRRKDNGNLTRGSPLS